jgi:hypothetical protein
LSVDEIADMDREVEDILQDSDGGETDEEQEREPVDFPSEHRNDEGEISSESNAFKTIRLQ